MTPVASPNPSLTEVYHDELAHLNYRRFLPHPLLRPWVQCYWSANLIDTPAKPYIERLYPDGGVSITLNLSGSGLHWISARQSLYTFVVDKPLDNIGIRFHPGGAQWLLQTPIHELVNDRYSVGDFTLSNIDSLIETLSDLPTTGTRLALVDSWLLDQWQRLLPEINLAQRFLFCSLGDKNDLDAWCTQQRISRRTVERSFKRYVGVSPNHLKSLQQVSRARTLIKENPTYSLALISQASGYYDQAHFTHQFRRITGQTPGQYQRRQLSKRSVM